jgi:hypothetical protein
VNRGQTDCAICMSSVSCQLSNDGMKGTLTMKGKNMTLQSQKKTLILSCSHLFHQQCLGNFEKFARNEVKNKIIFQNN